MFRIERWLEARLEPRLDLFVLAALLLVTIAHCRHAARYSLNPDEALHYNLGHQRSLYQAWAASNTNAHPPLLIVGLYFWRKLGTSELWLRMLPILSNAVLVWFGYRWMRNTAGGAAAVVFAGLLLFLPPLHGLATEVRQYMPMFAGIALALWGFDRALHSGSARSMAVSAMGMLVAALSNYSALWFWAGFGCYTLLRLWRERAPAALVRVWGYGQLSVAATYVFLYVTHISKFRSSALSAEIKAGYLRGLFRSPEEDLPGFLARSLSSLYEWAFAPGWPAWTAFVLAAAGFGVLVLRREPALPALLSVPFVCGFAAAAMGLLPFGGSRQCAVFVYLAGASIAIGVSSILKQRLIRTAAISVAALLLLHHEAEPEDFGLPLVLRQREYIGYAVDHLRGKVPQGGTVFADYQASLMLCYYYDPSQYCVDEAGGSMREIRLDRMRILTPYVWSFDRESFLEQWRAARPAYRLAEQPVWVFDAGWGQPVHEALNAYAEELREFPGNNIVFRISPAVP